LESIMRYGTAWIPDYPDSRDDAENSGEIKSNELLSEGIVS
jgi:hypothetical protein